jgi:hypothetical protein
MASVAPKARKHLSADALFRLVHTGFDHIPDYRPADVDMALSDVLMSAFAMFSLTAPSLLAFDKERAEGNWHTIHGITRVPCDTHMRAILDPVSPKLLRPMFTSLFRQLQRGKALAAMTCLDLPIRPIRSQLPKFQAADRESPPSPAVVGSLPVTLIRV